MNFYDARNIVIENVNPVPPEKISLSESAGRILAADITANYNIPMFDRSPYDGYAFRSQDVPGELNIICEIKAGDFINIALKKGEAAKILTGAAIPEGADAIIKYEDTEFTAEKVKISKTFRPGENIIKSGEDVKAGEIIAREGEFIDSGTAGLLASQNIFSVQVYRRPVIGIITTGNEIQELQSEILPGKIYNASHYTFMTALKLAGFEPKFMGICQDDAQKISDSIIESLSTCDSLILTGGVSAGDYDKTPDALKISGAKILFRDIDLKPGGKCIYAVKDNKLICCLSGNPASALTNYYAVALPALEKLSGSKNFIPDEIDITLANSFNKRSPMMRIIRGKLIIRDGQIFINVPSEQGNGVLSTMAGSNLMAVIPAGSDKLPENTRLKGFII